MSESDFENKPQETPPAQPVDTPMEAPLAPEGAQEQDPFIIPDADPAAQPATSDLTPEQQERRGMLKDGQLLLGQTVVPAIDVFDRVMEEPEDLKDDPGGPLPSTNTTVEHEWRMGAEVDGFEYSQKANPYEENISFYPERGEHVDKRVRAHIPIDQFQTAQGQWWNNTLQAGGGQSSFLENPTFAGSAARPGADWRQLVQTENGKLGMSRPRFREEDIVASSGPRAMLRVRALLGAGGIVQVPLWHSGFWVTMRTPSDNDLIELQRRMIDDKIQYGRDTHGLAFTHEQSYMTSWLFNFCMDHISESTAAFEGNTALMRQYIKAPDLNLMLWGLATLIWPRGFTYYRSLTTVDGIKQLKTVSGKLDIIKLLWTDRNMLKADQKKHMNTRTRLLHSVESIEKYQQMFDLSIGRKVQVNEQVGLVLGVPSIGKQIDEGVEWITGLVNMINETFTSTAPDSETRNNLLNLHTRVTMMRRNSAWVSAIDADGVLMTDKDDIGETLSLLASIDDDASLRNKLNADVSKFIDDICVSMVGIPETDGRDTGIPRFQNILPINVPQTFFILLAQRLQRLATT